ncbi:ferritin heavy chain-like [Lepus europaeus]|uniref:ferritin heavy chain-like n=1 Tax=Lepus europaeus TaxID=9983 RepID=UPI002B4A60D2|nr:ferritin heavy chain-like [Lepus europaeus]
MAAASSRVRHNYHPESEAAVNSHIHLLLYASYVALSMAFYFDQDDVALKGFARYFLKRSQIERERAEKLLKMQSQRGGRIVFQDIEKPERSDWEGGLQAMEVAFDLAMSINQSLLDVHDVATSRDDAHLCHFLETNYLDQQVQDIKELGNHLTNLHKMGTQNRGMTEYLFDRLTLGQDNKEN